MNKDKVVKRLDKEIKNAKQRIIFTSNEPEEVERWEFEGDELAIYLQGLIEGLSLAKHRIQK